MDFFSAGVVSVIIGLILGLILVILSELVGNDGFFWAGGIVFLLGIFVAIGIAIACGIVTKDPENYTAKKVELRSDAGNVYYIDEDNKLQVVDLSNIKVDIYATDGPSYVEFREAKWLCFTDTEVAYYIHIEE